MWAGFWGLFYRKFFWDFIGGTLRDPGGIQPSPKVEIFITLIVKVPLIQMLAIGMAFMMILLEYPLPYLKGTAIHRSLTLRVLMLILQASLAGLFYQGTNGAIWSLIAAVCYTRALILGETMKPAEENRGKGGLA